ncbi:MAG: FtsX-like permease family protein, partial [Odoribacter sp.]|nr:FtsX-like permease family protein [Odoribacter sp.]
LDKKEDLNIYKALGMSGKRIVSVFKTEGNMITTLGGIIGFLLGITICFLQEKYGFVKLGDGAYAIEAYPVKVIFKDIVMIMGLVLLIGYTASYFPVKYLIGRLIK